MAERFSRLFSLPENLYTENAPVLIAAGALLKDNQTNKVLAQLKLKSLSAKPIKAIKVSVAPVDTVGKPLGEPIESQYLDLTLRRDEECGQKQPIYLPDATTRGFSAVVTEVDFADNSIWTPESSTWEALAEAKPLQTLLHDEELEKQYRIKFGEDCAFVPSKTRDLWICACGAVNREDEAQCHKCGKLRTKLFEADLSLLAQEKDARLAAEEEKAAKEKAAAEKKAAEDKIAAEEKKRAQAKKTRRIATILIPVAILVLIAFVVISKVVIPHQKIEKSYQDAVELMNANQFDEAIAAFQILGEYKNSAELIPQIQEMKLNSQYNSAESLFMAGKYEEAISAYASLGDYRDSESKIAEAKDLLIDAQYAQAVKYESEKNYAQAAVLFGSLGDFKDSHDRSLKLWDKVAVRDSISIGFGEMSALKSNGTASWISLKKSGNFNGSNYIAVSSYYDSYALKKDGTVDFKGDDDKGEGKVSGWTDIVAIEAAPYDMVFGIKSDGTVVTAGQSAYGGGAVSSWSGIVAISAGYYHTVGLKADGTVVSTTINSRNNDYGQTDVSGWTDIIAISAGTDHTVGLKSDGTVVAVGNNDNGQIRVEKWSGIKAISAGAAVTVGLKSDGTVIYAGRNFKGLFDPLSRWKNVVAISAGGNNNALALLKDGTVVGTGYDFSNGADVSGWKNIKKP